MDGAHTAENVLIIDEVGSCSDLHTLVSYLSCVRGRGAIVVLVSALFR